MITVYNITYLHPDRDLLFENISLSISHRDKIALVGNNGVGKSTLLKLLAAGLKPAGGTLKIETQPYYIPQHFGQFNNYTIAQALDLEDKFNALKSILEGNVTEQNLAVLDDDWTIEERCREALSHWGLGEIDLSQSMSTLSGGQKTRVFLSGIAVHKPEIVLLDEPSNHLDEHGRNLLYNYISTSSATLLVVSHDRHLLNLLDTVYELSAHGIKVYGGNYDFYVAQKAIEATALNEEVKEKEKALRKAKELERASLERQQKLDARGKKKQEKAGLPTISMNTLRNNAEKSTARMKDVHAEKVGSMAQDLDHARKALPDKDKMKLDFDDAVLHKGKVLVTARDVNYLYGEHRLWETPLNFQITSGRRIAIKGSNGSGKTTLIKIILGALPPSLGAVNIADNKAIYIDQDYSLIDDRLSIFQQAQQFNITHLQDHEIKSRLTHFLFTKEDWDKSCSSLSGGEKMRLILCCLTISNKAPDMIVLDEPTNNLDIQNMEILTDAVNEYRGTLIVVSHDTYFLEQVNIQETIDLDLMSCLGPEITKATPKE